MKFHTNSLFALLSGAGLFLLHPAPPAQAQIGTNFPPPQRAYPYAVRELGEISSLGNVPVGCINNNAIFYGTRRDASTGGNPRAFWISGNQSGDLYYVAGTSSWSNGCNNNLVAVGTRQARASVWDINWSGVQFLPDDNNQFALFAGLPTAEAIGINASRQVVGYVSARLDGANRTKATLWLTSTTPNNSAVSRVDLGFGVARAINGVGQIMGTSTDTGGNNPRASFWGNDAARTRRLLFTIDSHANDINTSGQGVGSVSTVNGWRGFVTAAGAGATTLLNPISSLLANATVYTACSTQAINDGGTAVGQSWNANAGSLRATVWFGSRGRNLNDGVPTGTPTLTNAVDINSRGQILCEGWVNGTRRAYLLTPTGAPWTTL